MFDPSKEFSFSTFNPLGGRRKGWSDALESQVIQFDAEGNLKVRSLEAEEMKTRKIRLKQEEAEEIAPCNDLNEGDIYYNKTEKHFYGCDGENWKELDGSLLNN